MTVIFVFGSLGHYVINMNPIYFGRIMTYLQSNDLSYKGLNKKQTKKLNIALDYLQIPLPVRWDRKYLGRSLTLGDNNRVVSKSRLFGGSEGLRLEGVQSTQPCSKYSVQVVQGQNSFIGFATRHGFRKDTSNFKTCGWFIHVASGNLFSQDGIVSKAYGTAILVGSVVTVIHDTIQRHIEFQVNGKSLGVAFTNITNGKLFAAADIFDVYRAKLRIVDFFTPES